MEWDVSGEGYRTWQHPSQGDLDGAKGGHLESFLEDDGQISQAASHDSALVSGWIADPSTIPDNLRGRALVLLGSKGKGANPENVAVLRVPASKKQKPELVWRGSKLNYNQFHHFLFLE